MQFLTDVCGIHYPDNAGKELGVIYHLHSLQNNLRLRIKGFMPNDAPEIEANSNFLLSKWNTILLLNPNFFLIQPWKISS